MATITTRDDVGAWVANNNAHGYQSCTNASEVKTAIVEALVAGDHPAWGHDWSEYLDAFDFGSVVDPIAEN